MAWFAREGRSFPWRSLAGGERGAGIIHDPYLILVSEVMLQQTQTARVVAKLPAFLERFPDVHALAAASAGDLIRAWQGMGYNSRALRLQQAARAVVDRHDGRFPDDLDALRALPGVGDYTAGAVACFAFGHQVAVLDVNVIRVLSRLFFKCHTPAQSLPERTVRNVAWAILDGVDAYDWHQALMDLGATICTARRPACDRCPVRDVCLSESPLAIELYGAAHAAAPEPTLRGEPRRLWRGRVVEVLRTADEPVRVEELYARLLGDSEVEDAVERRAFTEVVAGLVRDRLVVRAGMVAEGELLEGDRVALPG